jgi:hypothetical protein
MIRALAFALLAALPFAAYALPGHARDFVSWGGFTVTLTPGDTCEASVNVHNVLTGIAGNMTQADLTLGALSVHVRVDHQSGDIPDRVTVTAPEGYVAAPAFIDIAEDADGIVRICSMQAVGM